MTTYTYGQTTAPTPPAAGKSKVIESAHRLVILNGSHVTVAYVPKKESLDPAIVELQERAKAESDEANRRALMEPSHIDTSIALASLRVLPTEETPVSIAQRVSVILKSGATVVGAPIRMSDVHLVLRTDDNLDFEISRSEIAAFGKRR